MVGAKIATLEKGANQHTAIAAPSQSAVSEQLKVSEDSIQRARKVVADGAPELVAAVESGKVSVSAAATIAEAPQEQQREIVAKGERAGRGFRLEHARPAPGGRAGAREGHFDPVPARQAERHARGASW